ncbi:MAG: SDR family oxidoreductase [Acidobacteria bacterium]|nr:SDR family oxidoreductase [Acidobacteriota bacterium]
MRRLENKVCVITGAANGIGAAMAALFAREGARVVVADVDERRGTAVAAALPDALFVKADVSRSSDVDALFAATVERYGGLDVLVNNAISLTGDTTIVEEDEAVFDHTIAVCLKGPFLCTRRAIPLMEKRGGGSIVTMSSVNALLGVGETAYTAAKGGLISMMRLVAAEYGSRKIRSNMICPGTIETETCMSYWQQFPEGYRKLLDMYPLGRIGKPEEVAQYALFLASEESAFVTGAVCVVDGGLLAGRRFETA